MKCLLVFLMFPTLDWLWLDTYIHTSSHPVGTADPPTLSKCPYCCSANLSLYFHASAMKTKHPLCFECESFKFIMDKSREGGTLKSLELYSGEGLFMGWNIFPVAQTVKKLPAMQETQVPSLGWKDPLEKGMAIHSSILAWRIPWTEEPGRLQSVGSQRVGQNWRD